MNGYLGNIEELTQKNESFRHVLYTSQHTQLVVMSLKPGEDIGQEVHDSIDQFLRVESGEGQLLIDGEYHAITAGDAFIVPAGAQHNVINTSQQNPLKLYTLYSPPHHADGTVHATKQDAAMDEDDHV